jgi:nucleoside-diphosphate-sugar epimerase
VRYWKTTWVWRRISSTFAVVTFEGRWAEVRVFVTGASGFIGSELSRALSDRGHRVSGLVRSDEGAARLRAVGGEPVRGDMR